MTDHSPLPTPDQYSLTIGQLLTPAVQHYPQQEIVFASHTRFSYNRLYRRIHQLCNLLLQRGIRPGMTVAVADWDSHRYLECYFAIPMVGATLMTLNVRLAPDQQHYTLQHANAQMVLVHDDFAPALATMQPELPAVTSWVRLTEQPDTAGHGGLPWCGEYEALLHARQEHAALPVISEHQRATLFYTTGTTGHPKGVSFSHRQLVLHSLAVTAALASPASGQRLHRQDVYMPITPMFHVHAWGLPYIATMLGLKQVYPGRYQAENLLELIRQEGVSFSHCVPTLLQMIFNAPGSDRYDLRQWKVIIGGARLPLALARQARSRGIDIWTGYGMSETGPILTLAQLRPDQHHTDDQATEQLCRAGMAIPLVELQVMDETGQPVNWDDQQQGEIVVRAPWLTQGYLHNEQASAELWAGGYLHTRDIGSISAQGSLRLTDRAKDMIKTGGEWISSQDIEHLLLHHPGVNDAAVIGIPHPLWGERPIAIIVANHDANRDALPDQIRQALAVQAEQGHLSRYAIPDQVYIADKLPRTSVGKTDKKQLRQVYVN